MLDREHNRLIDHYEDASEQLFIFHTELIKAGFTKDEAFELVRTCMNNSAIEQMAHSVRRRASENARLSEKLCELYKKENLND